MRTIRLSTIHGSLDGVDLAGWDWIGFTSVTGVNAFFELLAETGRDIREIGTAKIAAIGSATAEALKTHGLKVEYVPEIFDGVNLAEGLAKRIRDNIGGQTERTNSKNVLMFRAENGSEDISQVFSRYGISNKHVCIYRADYVQLFHVPKFTDIIIFTSASTVKGFCFSMKDMREVKAVCIGRQTANEAVRQGFTDVVIAEQADIDSLVKAVLSC